MTILKNKQEFRKSAVDYFIITVGTLLTAFGVVFFMEPFNIVAGGVSGLGIVFKVFFGWQLWIQVLIYNVMLFILGFKLLGIGFGVKSIYSSLMLSFFMAIFENFLSLNSMLTSFVTGSAVDMNLMGAIYGALISGAGMGLVIWRGATTGGTDILAMIINKYFNISVGTGLMACDSIITALSVFINPLLPMYGIMAIFVTGKTIDAIIDGLGSTRTVLIISEQYDKIKDEIYFQLDRGVTYIKGVGAYTGKDKNIVMVTVSRAEIGSLKKLVKSIDSKAFVVIIQNNEALGYGFKNLS